MLNVFLADDHEIVRAGLSTLIDDHPGMRVVGQAATGQGTLDALTRLAVDVLVLDLSLPDATGVEMVQRLRPAYPRLAILVLTMYPEDQLALTLIRAGAAGYLNKSRPPGEVLRAIERVGSGQPYLTDTLADLALDPDAGSDALPHTRLSAREYQTFMLLIGGRTVSEAAHEMRVSPSTVSTYVTKIKQKLGVGSVSEILRYAYRVGLLD